MRRVILGEYIEQCTEVNSAKEYGLADVRGVANTKGFIPTKANMEGRSFSTFSIIRPQSFAFNRRTTRNGERLGLGFNNTPKTFICTEDYVVFRVKEQYTNVLLPNFLYLNFLRDEFDRYVRWDSWGSATEFFNWENLLRVEIPLPDIEVQRDLVAIYEGLQKIVAENEELIAQLETVCHDFVVDCKDKYPKVKLGDWIEECDIRNRDGLFATNDVVGINIDKTFIPTVANLQSTDVSKYKIVPTGHFACNLMHIGRDVRIPIAYNYSAKSEIVSPAYFVFRIKKDALDRLSAEYLSQIFSRYEFDRFCWFSTDSSIRGNLQIDRFYDIKIPLPPFDTQNSIASVSNCLNEARRIVADARDLMKNICPALVQKAAHSA